MIKNALSVDYKKNDFIYIYINLVILIMYEYIDQFIKKHNIKFNYDKYTKDELEKINNIIETNNIIKTDSSELINFIGLYIEFEHLNIVKNYYKKGIEMNNICSINNYINILIKEKNYKEAKEYLLKGIELESKNIFYLNQYAKILEKENNINDAKQYYLKAISLNDKLSLANYMNLKISNINKYYDLSNIQSNLTKDILLDLKKDYNVIIFNNKIKNFTILQKCSYCKSNEEKLNIQLNCFLHLVCIDCYVRKKNCCYECGISLYI